MKKMKSLKWIIIGLGNPGKEHKFTRHNAGFMCLDMLASKYNIKINSLKFNSLIGLGEISNQQCLLMEPQTYMNNSGLAVLESLKYLKINPDHILVISDDISFSPGNLRVRRNGSSGGHKGLNSIIEHISTKEFPRIKIGVGQKPENCFLEDWVLTEFNYKEIIAIKEAIEKACIAIEMIVNGDIDKSMSKYNHLL